MTVDRDTQVWDGAVEILAAVKSVPFEYRFDAFALAFDAFVRTSGTIDIDYPEDRLDALWCLMNPSDTRYRLDRWNERPGTEGSTVITERLRREFRVRDWWPGMDSFDSARGETVPHPVAREAAAEIGALREIVRLVDEHLFHEMQHVPLTPELADAYDRAIVRRGSDSGRSTDA